MAQGNDELAIDSQTSFALGEHSVQVIRSAEGGNVRLLAPGGAQTLCIEIGPAGARLHLSHGLAIAIDGPLSFEADTVEIRGRENLRLGSAGDAQIAVAGHLGTTSRSNTVRTTHGDMQLDANDDVVLLGERVRVNC
jgi:hypothetical protein